MNLPAAETAGYLGKLFMLAQTLNSFNCPVHTVNIIIPQTPFTKGDSRKPHSRD
jgi:hypothetical protein